MIVATRRRCAARGPAAPPVWLLTALVLTPALPGWAQEPAPTTGRGASDDALTTLAGGVQYLDLEVGQGPAVRRGDTITVHYTGWLRDGTRFDTSRERGSAFVFKVGQGAVIKGWDAGVVGMQRDGKRRLIIPPRMAYGRRGVPDKIPPDATLVFEIELLAIQ
jgi:FKBP-type peptidyl-prolyl cis-trans isomerase FkpA